MSGPLPDAAGRVLFDVSLDLSGAEHADGGIRVRSRERFVVAVPAAFPFAVPSVTVTHARWAETPHVQWGRQLCLYGAPSVEWSPADGMRGLVERLVLWIERAAAGTLDPEGQPLHPPVAYIHGYAGHVVVRADLGALVPWAPGSSRPVRLLIAVCEMRGDRLDVVRWADPDEHAYESAEGRSVLFTADGTPLVAAAVVLVDHGPGFEYPASARLLADALIAAGLPEQDLLGLIGSAASANEAAAVARGDAPAGDGDGPGPGGAPAVVLVGTPSRSLGDGPRLAHLVAWRLDRLGGSLGSLVGGTTGGLNERSLALGGDWLGFARTLWLAVYEARPEVTRRRDEGSPARWLTGKRVLVLGCGALGGPIAELCARGGASKVVTVDNGVVTAGILVRQPYADADIGQHKAVALARRLAEQIPSLDVQGPAEDAVTSWCSPGGGARSFDLVVDATADVSVRSALELARALDGDWPHVVTVLIGHRARRGVVAVSLAGATGGGHDVLRRLGIAARTTRAQDLADIADDLYPAVPRTDVFTPEPGCSAPTFVGSAAEATALAGQLFTAALDALSGDGPPDSAMPMSAAAVRLADPHGPRGRARGVTWVGWPDDLVVPDAAGRLQVRIAAPALAEMRAEARRGARVRGPEVETGGTLLGAVDDAAGVVFVDAATGPPPDSLLSAIRFDHGVVGVQDIVDSQRRRTANATGYVGMWHTHPGGPAAPSPTDTAGMTNVVAPVADGPPRSLMLILGGEQGRWFLWTAAETHGAVPYAYARLVRRPPDGSAPPPVPPAPHATYFPGGYAPRAGTKPPAPRSGWRALLPWTRR